MEEDVLSDVVPSNIVSRQVKLGFVDYSQAQYLSSASQESEGGESEYDDEAAAEMHNSPTTPKPNAIGSMLDTTLSLSARLAAFFMSPTKRIQSSSRIS